MKKLLLLLTLLCACAGGVLANNIRIIGLPVLKDQNEKTHTVKIKFDIAWDNSWRTSRPNNYDAAWIFVKCWDGEAWNHVYLDSTGYIAGSTTASDAVNSGTKYSVTNRDASKTDLPMELIPGYSMAWKKWKLDPTEKAQKCVVGFFLQRKTAGAGHVVVPGVTFTWNYAEQDFLDGDDLVVKVFAVEMVYVPTGDYYLGGRGTAGSQYGSFTMSAGSTLDPYVVTSEKAITVNTTAGATSLWALNSAMVAGSIPEAFPKGYQAFYIMKYELTQEAWCEFLNSLNQGQQNGRVTINLTTALVNQWPYKSDGTTLAMYRNYVRIKQAAPSVIFGCDANLNGTYNEAANVTVDGRTLLRNNDGQDLAMNFVSFNDLLAYAEFSGLRPMTELEYEKACRGTREPVNDEYVWGSVTAVFFGQANPSAGVYTARNGVTNLNNGQEAASGNVGYVRGWNTSKTNNTAWWVGGTKTWTWTHTYYPAPLRVGAFATSKSSRAEAGSTYWGVMNMSDNVAEMCISAYTTTGRAFTGVHGSGLLDGNGAAQCTGWHMSTSANYYIFRGMVFDIQSTTATLTGATYKASWWTATGSWWAYCTNGACREAAEPAATDANAPRGRVLYNEINYNYGNMNRWQHYAGMISSRHMYAHTCGVADREISTNGNQTGAKPMRGIRCVRTAGAAQ